MPHRSREPVIVLCLILLCLGQVGLAQETPEPPPQEPAPPEIIPAPRVAQRSQEALAELEEYRARLTASDRLASIESALPKTREEIEALRQTTDEVPMDQASFQRLSTLGQQWARYQERLGGWARTLEKEAEELYKQGARLEELTDLWQRTQGKAREERVPQALLERIQTVLDELAGAKKQVDQRVRSVLRLQDAVAEEQSDVSSRKSRLDEMSADAGRWLTRDSPPLWATPPTPRTGADLRVQLDKTWAQLETSLVGFWADNKDKVVGHLVLLVGLTLVLAGLRWRARQWKEEEGIDLALYFLSRPLASAILVTILVAFLLFPSLPTAVAEVAATLLLYSFVRILPGLLQPSLQRILYPLAAVFLLDRVERVVGEFWLLHRVVLLLITMLMLGVGVWLLRSEAGKTGLRRIGPFVSTALPISVFLLAVSLVSNVLGNVTLAALLKDGVLNSTYLALIIVAGFRVLDAALVVGMRVWPLNRLRAVRSSARVIREHFTRTSITLARILWILAVLEFFHVWAPVRTWLTGFLGNRWGFGTVEISLGGILLFFLTLWLAFKVSRLLRFFLEQDVLPRMGLGRGVPQSISMGVNYIVIGLGFLLALGLAGVELSNLALVAGALGVGIGFGLQNLVNNFVSGLILMFERPIQVGDTVQMGTMVGRVLRIGMRSSTVKSFDGAEVIIPNGTLIASELVNWTLSDSLRRVEVKVGVTYGADVDQVHETLLETVKTHQDILTQPKPFVIFQGFGDSSLDFSLFFWTANLQDWWTIRSDITKAVRKALQAADIEIPFPQRDLHLRSVHVPITGEITAPPEARPEPRAPEKPEKRPASVPSGRGPAAADAGSREGDDDGGL